MDVGAVLMTHTLANQEGKMPFFFSRFNFQRMKERGNTHYCFHCGGEWGFIPGEKGEATNCEDNKIQLIKEDGSQVTYEDAIADDKLRAHIYEGPGYPCKNKKDSGYNEYLKWSASFVYEPSFIAWCEQNRYKIYRWNPMRKHNPTSHAMAVVGGADGFNYVHSWFEEMQLPPEFPYIVCLR